MRETRADNALALAGALLLHALPLLLLLAWWKHDFASQAAGDPVSADLVDPNALSRAMQRALDDRPEPATPPAERPQPEQEAETAPAPQPLPEPLPEDSPVEQQLQAQERVPDPDTEQQEAVRRDALSAETREREQEEKRRQEQIDLTERERRDEAERRQRLSEMQLEREKQLADIRRQRALAAREAQLAEEKLKQLADRRAQQASAAAASASPPPGDAGVDPGLGAQYAAALSDAIRRNWTRPDNIPIGQRCRLTIRQLPGGQVVDVEVSPACPYDELGRRSVEAAVLKAQPLPYAGFEKVFNRTLILNFDPQER